MLEKNSQENFKEEEYQESIHEFVDEMLRLCKSETDFETMYRELEFARIWLENWSKNSSEDDGAGKKGGGCLQVCQRGVGISTFGMGVIT